MTELKVCWLALWNSLTHLIPMTSRDVSRSRSTRVRRHPETFF